MIYHRSRPWCSSIEQTGWVVRLGTWLVRNVTAAGWSRHDIIGVLGRNFRYRVYTRKLNIGGPEGLLWVTGWCFLVLIRQFLVYVHWKLILEHNFKYFIPPWQTFLCSFRFSLKQTWLQHFGPPHLQTHILALLLRMFWHWTLLQIAAEAIVHSKLIIWK